MNHSKSDWWINTIFVILIIKNSFFNLESNISRLKIINILKFHAIRSTHNPLLDIHLDQDHKVDYINKLTSSVYISRCGCPPRLGWWRASRPTRQLAAAGPAQAGRRRTVLGPPPCSELAPPGSPQAPSDYWGRVRQRSFLLPGSSEPVGDLMKRI